MFLIIEKIFFNFEKNLICSKSQIQILEVSLLLSRLQEKELFYFFEHILCTDMIQNIKNSNFLKKFCKILSISLIEINISKNKKIQVVKNLVFNLILKIFNLIY